MTPYYSDDFVTIYHGDCREVTEWLTADVLVTDPPYGTGHYGLDVVVVTPTLLGEWVDRFTAVAIFGYAELLCELLAGRRPKEWVTWWPTNAAVRGMNPSGLRREAEHIALFGDVAGLREQRIPRSATTSRIRGAGYVSPAPTSKWAEFEHGNPDSRRVGDVWTDVAPGLGFNSADRLHPNQKSLSLMSRLVGGLTSLGQVVVDPFAGSGTTLLAAKNLGHRAIGIEVDERYCEIAARRCSQEVLDLWGAS